MKLKRRYHKILWGIQNAIHAWRFDQRERRKAKAATRPNPSDSFAETIRRAFQS